MAFTVENGTGLTNANAYASIVQVADYLSSRGDDESWVASNESSKQVAIIRATDYIDNRWGGSFKGTPLLETQALAFPRSGYLAVLPALLIQATSEYAKRALSGHLAVDPIPSVDGVIKRKREKLASLEEETEYFESSNAQSSEYPVYPRADMLMERLIALSSYAPSYGSTTR